MKFNDEGIIISIRKYSENSLIVKVFCRQHGIYRAFIKSTKSSKDKVIFQIGNFISFEYRSRIEENLGSFFAVDLIRSYCSKIMFDALKLDCIKSLFSMIDELFLERESYELLFEKLILFLQKISTDEVKSSDFLAHYIKLELKLLKSMGYGIDLSSCAVTNSTNNLAFVSPKSARAVCFEVGKPYENKLLRLPNFLTQEEDKIVECEKSHLLQGLELSGFFLKKFLFEEKNLTFSHRDNIKSKLKI
jgi:DNA repair protein RecO (recombination protein O)